MDSHESKSAEQKGHLFIAGTGRTGTSFLVRYLSELGLDTHISRHGCAQWDANANEGFEDAPLAVGAEQLPYVVKSPWIGEYIDQILAKREIKIDAVIVPVRDLIEVAASRTIVESRALYQTAPWMAELDGTWENWGVTAGGVVFSLNPVDQARILAVGFHRLVQRCVNADIPLVFVAFPRFIEDGEYLFNKLRAILPLQVTDNQARTAHARVADRQKVRVGRELDSAVEAHRGSLIATTPGNLYPDTGQIDRAALRREIVRLNGERAQVQAALKEQASTIKAQSDAQAASAAQVRALKQVIDGCDRKIAGLNESLATRDANIATISEAMAKRDIMIEALLASRSWRFTAPLRWVRRLITK
jgi:hypothetical protein